MPHPLRVTWRPACRLLRVAALLCALAVPGSAAGGPSVASLESQAGRVRVSGSGFGAGCPGCEVVADYGGGLRYALEAEQWNDGFILARLPDLARGERVTLAVHTAEGVSNARSIPLPVKQITDRGDRYFRESDLAVGARGVDRHDVSQEAPACGRTGLRFEAARVLLLGQRFGLARLVSAPPSGCTRCDPVVVDWFHEPTGRLAYQLEVTWREIEGICSERRR